MPVSEISLLKVLPRIGSAIHYIKRKIGVFANALGSYE